MKQGYRTTEFWLSNLVIIASVGASAFDSASHSFSSLAFGAVAAGLYALARGIAKRGRRLRAGWRTTEFWQSAVVISGSCLEAIGGHVPPDLAAGLLAISVGLYTLGRLLAKTGSEVAPAPNDKDVE